MLRTSKDEKLSCVPCPFCGCEDFGIGRGVEDREVVTVNQGYPTYVYCGTCGARGPWIYTRDKGIWTCTSLACEQTGWNKRIGITHGRSEEMF